MLPELVLGELPPGTHVLVMTHDHAEDAAIIDAALRTTHLGSIGLIGSAAKWSRFRAKLAAEGHDEQAIARVITPDRDRRTLTGKEPATIAVEVAAALLREFERAVASRVPPGSCRARSGSRRLAMTIFRGRSWTPPTTRSPAGPCAPSPTAPCWCGTG